jgi:hypothetical protein
MNSKQYVYDALAGWMEDEAPDVLVEIRSNDIQATTTAILGWMAKHRRDELRFIQDMEWEYGEADLTLSERKCQVALIDAIEGVLGPRWNVAAVLRAEAIADLPKTEPIGQA